MPLNGRLFVRGSGKMLIDEVESPITVGDAVCLPLKTKHQVINSANDLIEYLNISAIVES